MRRGRLQGIAAFDPLGHRQELRGGDFGDGAAAQVGEHVRFDPMQDVAGVVLGARTFPVFVPGAGDGLEGDA